MGNVRPFNPVKPFAGVLFSDEQLVPLVREQLVTLFGPIDDQTGLLKFESTDYYSEEMGDALDRIFFSFENLVKADSLESMKLETNRIESELAFVSKGVTRPVNLDPGYIEQSKVILFSTKNFYHRAYIGSGIFAEVTMHFKKNGNQFFPWTYPDYQSPASQKFFDRMRRTYREQLESRNLENQDSKT